MAVTISGQTTSAAESDQAVDLLRRTIVQLQPGIERLGERWPHLTMQQLRIMRILYADGPTRVSSLARRLRVSTPTVTGILDRLVQRGMTRREDDPRDRRVVLNVLTPDGRKVIESLHPIQVNHLNDLVDRLSHDDRQKLVDGLSRLLRAADRLA